MKTRGMVLLFGGLMLASGTAAAGVSWSYSGATGPADWAKLSPGFAGCAGKNQSPIDLRGFVAAGLQPIQFSYRADGNVIFNDGHTVQVDFTPGSSISVGGTRFNLVQLHFHTPSENLIEGRSYPLEMHLVHADHNGNLAVVAVMFRAGAANPALAKLLASMPGEAGERKSLPAPFDAASLLPAGRGYYRYDGSLTTPPCTEGVRWLVLKTPLTASKEQIAAFSGVMGKNNRPVQALNARLVLEPAPE